MGFNIRRLGIHASLPSVSIPHRDLDGFQHGIKYHEIMPGDVFVSIPHRDLDGFQPLASETLAVFSFQGSFPTHTPNYSSLKAKKPMKIAQTLVLSSPTLPQPSKKL